MSPNVTSLYTCCSLCLESPLSADLYLSILSAHSLPKIINVEGRQDSVLFTIIYPELRTVPGTEQTIFVERTIGTNAVVASEDRKGLSENMDI